MKEISDFNDTIEYLYSLLPMYQRIGPAAYKKDLSNIKELLWNLGLPQWEYKSVHIAGTNGKGSVASMLSSILQSEGLKVGLYTSPHLLSFTERIKVNGKSIPEKEVTAFVKRNKEMIEQIMPSFFELTVAMAFRYFADKDVDLAVVEVGLGGRLDSTNIIFPEISVITNISLDHQQMLGNTLEEIAGEKAGIIKRFTPVIIGQSQKEVQSVFLKKAAELSAPISFADQKFKPTRVAQSLHTQTVEVRHMIDEEEEEEEKLTYTLDLKGDYQLPNLGTVLQAVEIMREDSWIISDKSVVKGLRNVKKNTGLRGRMEVLHEKPLVIADTGHNEAGIEQIFGQISQMDIGQLHIVWGTVADKDQLALLKLLPKNGRYYFVKPDVPRGQDVDTLHSLASRFELKGDPYTSVSEGVKAALDVAQEDDLILIGGSTFVVAEALHIWELENAVN